MNRKWSFALMVPLLLAVSSCSYVLPSLGKLPEGEHLQSVQASPQYRDGQFQNEVATPMRTGGGISTLVAMIRGRFEPRDRPSPELPLPTVKTDLAALDRNEDTVIWLGHSSYFVQVGGKRLLVDPVFSSYAAPLPGMVRAFQGTTIYAMDEIPPVDYILISHDHYDHLDRATILALQSKVRFVLVGLGVGAHLEHWGLPKDQIKEGDWQTTFEVDPGIRIHLLPSRHYSGRFVDRNQSLWVSFVVETATCRLYFSGDTGFGPHFADIGKRFGSFDLVALDSGQYNERWSNIHMNPEEAARAAEILGAKRVLTAHAGRFTLARHAWDEPFRRAVEASKGKSYRLLTPRIGEPVRLNDDSQTLVRWWEGIP